MQQTKTYKLNLIETSDTFSPNPLNENMEKLEAVITAGADAGAEADAALEQRVTVLEAHKVAAGSYTGDDASSQTIALPFTPIAVYVDGASLKALAVQGADAGSVAIKDGGFQVSGSFNSKSIHHFPYFAFC